MDIEFTLSPLKEDISSIYDGLADFNVPHFPEIEENTCALFVRNEQGVLLGGLTAKFFFTSMHINYFWLTEAIRGNGIGHRLIAQAEEEAIKLKIKNLYLDTYTFQAPDFYLKQGFHEVGRYSDYPLKGVDKVFFQKRIGLD